MGFLAKIASMKTHAYMKIYSSLEKHLEISFLLVRIVASSCILSSMPEFKMGRNMKELRANSSTF